jgi:protein arginine kinase activator
VRCEACSQAEATVHLIEVVDGRKREVHLCAPCAESRGVVIDPSVLQVAAQQVSEVVGGTMAELLGSGRLAPGPRKTCPSCGSTLEDFRQTSRFGCPEDYNVFREEIEPLLARVQRTVGPPRHTGRVSERAQGRRRRSKRLESLRAELDLAVANEDFERAAALRDQLRCLEQGEPGPP